jgi:N-acetylmuramoyl-L-alanine amidase
MKRDLSAGTQFAIGKVFLSIALLAALAPGSKADKRSDARDEFERAVKMRTVLEGSPEQDRTLSAYKQCVSAYHKVYLITPRADEVTPSLIAEAELYREMGRQFDPAYFQSAIDTYRFLLKQYPKSRYRSAALFTIAQIQKDDLEQADHAEATLKEYLKLFPQSDMADDARQSLQDIASARENNAADDSIIGGQSAEPRESTTGIPNVTDIRTWNADNYTRVVVTLDGTVKYDASRISSPDRIYFDLYKARITHVLANKSLQLGDGLLKSVRVAQNKQGVVRLVLDVNGAKDYSAFMLSNPYRLVIDVRSQASVVANRGAAASPPPAKTDTLQPAASADAAASASTETKAPQPRADNPPTGPAPKSNATAGSSTSKSRGKTTAALQPPAMPKPNRDGQISLTRTLGLKISRIVIDPGHGGQDTGTIGPHGLMEKDLCLDVALRLGRLIEEKLPGAEVVYTRKDDTFIPLEERTAIANQAKADLFVSIHANSSHDRSARGVETFYLNFATSEESMEVASRENALSQESLHDLQDLIKKIARNEKIEESKELASDIQDSLAQRLQLVSHSERNRGVKKAPFVVLIGANMPSVLTEISFVSNPSDEKLLRRSDQRQRIADGLYRGITAYLDSLNSLSYNQQKPPSGNELDERPVAQAGNPK